MIDWQKVISTVYSQTNEMKSARGTVTKPMDHRKSPCGLVSIQELSGQFIVKANAVCFPCMDIYIYNPYLLDSNMEPTCAKIWRSTMAPHLCVRNQFNKEFETSNHFVNFNLFYGRLSCLSTYVQGCQHFCPQLYFYSTTLISIIFSRR